MLPRQDVWLLTMSNSLVRCLDIKISTAPELARRLAAADAKQPAGTLRSDSRDLAMEVAGEFQCQVGLTEIMQQAAQHHRDRAADYKPNSQLHALLDRIASDVQALGSG